MPKTVMTPECSWNSRSSFGPETGPPELEPQLLRTPARARGTVHGLDSYGANSLGGKVARFAGGSAGEARRGRARVQATRSANRAGVHPPVEMRHRGKRACRTRSGSPAGA